MASVSSRSSPRCATRYRAHFLLPFSSSRLFSFFLLPPFVGFLLHSHIDYSPFPSFLLHLLLSPAPLPCHLISSSFSSSDQVSFSRGRNIIFVTKRFIRRSQGRTPLLPSRPFPSRTRRFLHGKRAKARTSKSAAPTNLLTTSLRHIARNEKGRRCLIC